MFKKALSLVLALMLVVTSLAITAVSVSAEETEQETWILAGSESFFGSNWFEADENNQMEAVGDGTYTKVYENVAASEATIQCKVTNGTWEVAYPEQNYEFKVVEACDVTFTFDPATATLSVSGDGVELPEALQIEGVNVVGAAVKDSPNWLNGISWDPSANEMIPVEGEEGVYTATFEDLVEGSFQFKFAINGTQNKEKGGTGWESNFGGKFTKTGEWTEGAWDGDNIIAVIDDNDDEAEDLTVDVTLTVDLKDFDYSTKKGAKFKIDVFDKAGNPLDFPVEEEVDETTEPAQEDETTAPEAEETTAPAEEPGDGSALSVKATSNYFPEWTTNFTAEELEANNNLVTVTYFIDLGDIEMINASFVLKYDPTVLKYEAANNTHKIGKKSAETIMPYIKQFGGVVDNPTFAEDTMKGNCSDAQDGYIMTGEDEEGNPGGVVPFVSVTFTAIGTGNTTVDLELELMQIADKDAGEDEYYYVKDSAIVKDSVETATQSSVYGGEYQESYTNPEKPDEPIATKPAETEPEETTAAPVEETTAAPVEETTAAPVEETTEPASSDDTLTINAVSNILSSTSATFKGSEIPEQATVRYYLNSDQATLVNSQVVIKYDPKVLSLKESNNKNKKGKSTLSPLALDWGTGVVVNYKTDGEGNELGEVKINFSEMEGISLAVDGDPIPVYELVFDVVGTGETTVECEVQTITFKDAGTPTSDAYWYQPQTLAGGFNQDDYNEMAGKCTMKTTINDIEGGEVEPSAPVEETTAAPEPTTVPEPAEEGFFYIVGNAALVPTAWEVDAAIDDAETQMHLNDDGLYEYTFENLAANEPKAMYQLKVIEAPDNDASQAIWHGYNGTDMNVDFVVTQPCDVKVTYNPETGEIIVSGEYVESPSADFEVIRTVGSAAADSPNYLHGISWNPAADENIMEKIADGLYKIEYTELQENTYQLKFTADSQNPSDWSINWGGVAGERQETENGYVITGPAVYNGDNIYLDCEDDDDDNDLVYDLVITFDLRNFNATTKEGAVFTAEFTRAQEVVPTTAPVEETTAAPVEETTAPVEETTAAPVPETISVTQKLNGTDTIGTITKNVGDEIEIVYTLKSDKKLISTQWTFTYDPNMLELVDVNENFMPFTSTESGAMYNTLVNGEVKGSVSDINGFDFSTETTFVKVTLRGIESGSTEVNLQLEAMYFDEPPVEETTAEPTSEPAEETTAPVEETTVPEAEETTAPVEETTAPAEETTAPAEEPTTTPDATSASVQPTTTGGSTSDTPTNPGGNTSGGTNGSVQTGSASMALIILIVLLSGTAAIFFARKREKK